MRRSLLMLLSLIGLGCGLPPGRAVLPPDSAVPDRTPDQPSRPRHPTQLDILVLRTWNPDGIWFAGLTASAVQEFMKAVLAPPDGRPIRDLHFGVVSSKIDMAQVCNESDHVINDGTLLTPKVVDSQPPPHLKWPPTWKWPPQFPYLTGEMAHTVDLPSAASLYVYGNDPIEAECYVNQFLESTLRAVDGRNPGFVRPDSLLLVWIFADNEDCSTADPKLWERSLWMPEYGNPGYRCYEPPSGLLYPVERYLEGFARLHPQGRILFAVTGRDEKPVWDPGPPKRVKVLCYYEHVFPAPRLGAFVRGINALHDPNQEAYLMEPCVYIASEDAPRRAQGRQIAERVLEIMSR